MTKRIIALALLLLVVVLPAVACQFYFRLTGEDGTARRIVPGEAVSLTLGRVYELDVVYAEDHNRCEVRPAETRFYLDDERWSAEKDYLSLTLLSQGAWQSTGTRQWRTVFRFTASSAGTSALEIVRSCPRGGYDDMLYFTVA